MSSNLKKKEQSPHIDDWLDEPVTASDPEMNNLCYAKFVLEFARMPAFKQTQYKQWIEQFELFCTFEGKRYRVNGGSRMGDVWLEENFKKTSGYSKRVSVTECSDWSPKP